MSKVFRTLAALTMVCAPGMALAKAVTSPLSPDQPLVNPAAAVTRPFNSVSLQVNRNDEKSKALELTDSSFTVDTVVDSLKLNAAWNWRSIVFTELNYSPQQGTKTTTNSFQTGSGNAVTTSNKTLASKIKLNPVQGLLGIKFGPKFSIGFKTLAAFADFQSNADYQTKNATGTNKVTENSTLNARFMVSGIGAVYNVYDRYFVSYLAEFTELKTKNTLLGESTATVGNNERVVETDRDSEDTVKVRKDVVGIGYLDQRNKNEIVRLELSYEVIPPLNPAFGLEKGQLVRAIGETTWSYFHVGAEVSAKKGYYVDPYNLIPYYFKFENFSNTASTEYGVFGGFRWSKGHSLSASVYQSTETKDEPLSFSDPTLFKVSRTTLSFGLNYYFLF